MLGLGFRHENRNNETASDFAQDLKKIKLVLDFSFPSLTDPTVLMLAKKGKRKKEDLTSSFSQDEEDPTEYSKHSGNRNKDAHPFSGPARFVAIYIENAGARDHALRGKFRLIHALTAGAAGVSPF